MAKTVKSPIDITKLVPKKIGEKLAKKFPDTTTFGQLLSSAAKANPISSGLATLKSKDLAKDVPQKVPFLTGEAGIKNLEVTLPSITFNKKRPPGAIRSIVESVANLPIRIQEWKINAPLQMAKGTVAHMGNFVDIVTGKEIQPQHLIADSADILEGALAAQFFWKTPAPFKAGKALQKAGEKVAPAIYNKLPSSLKKAIIRRALDTAVSWGPYATKEAFYQQLRLNQDQPSVQQQLAKSVAPAVKEGIKNTISAILFNEVLHQGKTRLSPTGGSTQMPPTTQTGPGISGQQGQVSSPANLAQNRIPVNKGEYRTENFLNPTKQWNAQKTFLDKTSTSVNESQAGFLNLGASIGGEKPPKNMAEPVNKIISLLTTQAKPIRGRQEALYSAERSRRAARVAAVGQRVSGEKGYFAQLGQLKGPLPKAKFESIRDFVGQKDIDTMFNQVEKSPLLPLEKVTAKTGLAKLLGAEGGTVPTNSEITLLHAIFGRDFTKAVLSKQATSQKILRGVGEVLNLPRSLMSSFDMSAPLRQGVFLIGRPKQWVPAFGNMFKYFFSEKAYDGLGANIKARPTYKQMRQNGLALTDTGPVLSGREEAFMSNLASKIPGIGKVVGASNRAYSGFLNKLRADVFDDLYRKAKVQGVEKEAAPSIARFINSATGRGDLGPLNRAAVALNSVFFSPRLMASRINLMNPQYYMSLHPFARKEALKSLLSFAGTALTVASLAKLGGADVGYDPRSANFGKIKVGNTRYDPWGGFQQYIRLGAQLLTGQIVSSTSGKTITLGEGYRPLTRKEIALRFFESKEAPVASFITGALQGETAIGQPFNLPAEAIDRFIPMVIQDAYDLYKEHGADGIPMAAPAIFGVGSQTYGREVPQLSVTKAGKTSVKGKPVPGLGEDLAKRLFPPNDPEEEVEEVMQMLRDKELSPESAKQQIKQLMLQSMAMDINGNPTQTSQLQQVYMFKLQDTLKSDIKAILKDYTLKESEKKKQVDNLMQHYYETIQQYNEQ